MQNVDGRSTSVPRGAFYCRHLQHWSVTVAPSGHACLECPTMAGYSCQGMFRRNNSTTSTPTSIAMTTKTTTNSQQ
eukprot:4668303-Amphidinium_carterae.1